MSSATVKDVAIVIPLYNQLAYTRICLESLRGEGLGEADVLLIDNASTDGTADFLAGLQGVRALINGENLGCAGAWNQGVRETGADWVVILNNDVIVSPGWLQGMLTAAERHRLDLVSPSIREGEYNYDIAAYAGDFVRRMEREVRRGTADGICFMVRRQVFETIGGFDENFRIGQFEDTDFFRRAARAGFRLGTVGASFIHHFGSVTQKALSGSRPEPPYVAANRAYFRRKWQLGPWRRFIERRQRKLRELFWRVGERLRHGHTMKEKWLEGRLRYF